MPIKAMFDDMHDIASQLAMKWARHGSGNPIMVTDDFTRLTLDTIALCAMDSRFNSYYHDEMHPFIEAMGDFLVESGNRAHRLGLPLVFYRQANQKYENCSVVFAKSYIDQYNGLFRQYHGFLMNNHCFTNISMDWPVFIY